MGEKDCVLSRFRVKSVGAAWRRESRCLAEIKVTISDEIGRCTGRRGGSRNPLADIGYSIRNESVDAARRLGVNWCI